MTTLPAVASVVQPAYLPRTAAKKAPARSFVYAAATGTLTTAVGNKVTVYQLREYTHVRFPERGFRLDKMTAGQDPTEAGYDVLLSPDGDSCTCKGHTAHGHCTHVDALYEVIGRGDMADQADPRDGGPCDFCDSRRTVAVVTDEGQRVPVPCPSCRAEFGPDAA